MVGAGEINIKDSSNKSEEVTYIVNPDYWAYLLIDFGFNQLKLHRIFATCDPRNIVSSKVLGKLGLTKEGRIRESQLVKDGWRDSLLFSVLEHEWGK